MAFYSDWRVRSRFNLLTFPFIITMTIVAALAVHAKNKASLQDNLIKRAQSVSRQLMADRQYYATVIVPRLTELGGSVGADYQQVHGQFPLPATFVREVAELTASERDGFKINLISPWPINKTKGISDRFEREAFEHLLANPSGQFFRLDTLNGQTVFRFMTTDRAVAQSCVDCHNAHPMSPKRDFKPRDVMGGLETIFPVGQYQKEDRRDLLVTIGGGLGFALLLMLVSAWGAHRTVTRPLMALAFRLEKRFRLREGRSTEDMLETSGNEMRRFEELFDRIQSSLALPHKEMQTELKKLEADNRDLKKKAEEFSRLSTGGSARDLGREAFFYVDPAGEIQWVNRTAETLTGRSTAELVGQSFLIFLTTESAARAHAYILGMQPAESASSPDKYELIHKTGGSVWLEITAVRVVGGGKEGRGLLLKATESSARLSGSR
jgi:PAS domain S-box-containing protein